MSRTGARTRRSAPWLPFALLVVPFATLLGCGQGEPPEATPEADVVQEAAPAPAPQETFWASLQELCGQAFEGEVIHDTPATPDSPFAGVALVMHVRECAPEEIRIPFHAGEDRSRTWVLTRLPEGIRLKHHHLHEDGTPDAVHLYGGETVDEGTEERQDFPADEYTAELLPYAATNVWAMEVIPGRMFAYDLRREGTDRSFRVEFDLTRPVAPPPPPWGS